MPDRPLDWYLTTHPDTNASEWLWVDDYSRPARSVHSAAMLTGTVHLLRQVHTRCGAPLPASAERLLTVPRSNHTVEALTRAAGISATTVYAWLAGRRWPRLDTLLQLLAADRYRLDLVPAPAVPDPDEHLRLAARPPHGGRLRRGREK